MATFLLTPSKNRKQIKKTKTNKHGWFIPHKIFWGLKVIKYENLDPHLEVLGPRVGSGAQLWESPGPDCRFKGAAAPLLGLMRTAAAALNLSMWRNTGSGSTEFCCSGSAQIWTSFTLLTDLISISRTQRSEGKERFNLIIVSWNVLNGQTARRCYFFKIFFTKSLNFDGLFI